MYDLAGPEDLPATFSDPRCNDFIAVCSNGWEGGICIASAFSHNPRSWPQCFPNGPDADCTCTVEYLRPVPAIEQPRGVTMQSFSNSLTDFIEHFQEDHPDTALEDVIAALEAKVIALRQEIMGAGNPGAN